MGHSINCENPEEKNQARRTENFFKTEHKKGADEIINHRKKPVTVQNS